MYGTLQLYVIYDKVGESAGFVFEQQNDLSAIRSIKKQVTEDKNDFLLYRIGNIDHRTMKTTAYEPILINWLDEKGEQ